MATQRRKNTPASKTKPEEPAGLRWQQPPLKPRKQMRRVQTTAGRTTASGASPRHSQVRQEPRLRRGAAWRNYARITLIALVVIGCIVGFGELLRLPQLTVTPSMTQIGGSQRISTQEIFTASQVDGHNIMLIRPAEVAERVAAVPGIASVDVHVRLPNQVLIDVQEHRPLVAWQAVTTTLWLSADGSEVPQAGAPPTLNLTDLTGIPLGESRSTWLPILPQLGELRQALPDLTESLIWQVRGAVFPDPGRVDCVAGE